MKNLLLLPLIAISLMATAQTTSIPDVNFEQALINLGYDNVIDGGVLTANISGVTSLVVQSQNISDLTGIEDFTALDHLNCNNNQLTSLDVSQNTALEHLDCSNNQLTSLDVTQNTALEDLYCYNNQLTSLDVSQNTALTWLNCNNNQITNLDLSNNVDSLSMVGCGNNQLTCLNVANGNNNNLNINAQNNPGLTCIEVDDVAWSTANWLSIDSLTSFSTNCGNPCSSTASPGLYVIDVCGTITNAGAGELVAVNFDFQGAGGQQFATTDSNGTWCVVYTVFDTLGTGDYLDIQAVQQSCASLGYDTLFNQFVSTDTSFTMSWIDCNNNNCAVAIVDSFGIDLCAIPTGVAPFIYSWSDGSTGQCISNLLPNTLYSVAVIDANGCTSTANYLTTGGGCSVQSYFNGDTLGLANFSASANSGTAPFTYLWDFGDGNTGTGQTVSNLYSGSNSTFIVCVTMSDGLGCTSSDCQTITLSGNPNQQTCDVLLSYYADTTAPTAATVILEAYPTGVAPFTYSWYFSDGTSSTLANPTHTFTQGSSWDWACVEVTDVNGCVASYCDYIQIVVPVPSCYADFYGDFNNVSGNAGEVFFYDLSYGSANIVSWLWDLGDGSTSTLQNPSNTYTTAGYYTVCLTTTDANGCTASYCQTCYIEPAWWVSSPWNTGATTCSANFFTVQDTTLPGMIYLVDLSLGSNLYYSWDFGNGVLINNQYPVVTFTNFGSYNVCLTVTDTVSGCSDMYCDTLSIDSLGNLNKLTNWGISVIPTPMPQMMMPTAVEEGMESMNSVTLYPNPASSKVNLVVTLSVTEAVNVQLLDITGKSVSNKEVIMNSGTNNFELTTETLPNGVYFVKVKSSQVNETERVIVQH